MTLRIGSNLADPLQTAQHARLSEEAGFDFVGAGEHVFRDNRPGSTQIALSALATAAGATSHIRLLTSVVIVPLHHPVMLAKEATIVDAASGGRLTFGIGVGGEFPSEWDALDVPTKERGARTDESLELMKRLWSEKDVTHEGRFFSCNGITLYTSSPQAGGPPLWGGGRAEVGMRRAVKYGDGWLPYLFRPSNYTRSYETVGNMLVEAGRDPETFGWGLHLMTALGESREEALATATAGLEAGYNYDGDYSELAERYCLLGTPDECVDQLIAFREAGAQDILLSWLAPANRISEQIEVAGREILPRL